MIRLLHISDLHASDALGDDPGLLVKAMLRDAALVSQGHVDLVVISGDIAAKGHPEEFKHAHVLLLDPLMRQFSLGPERIVMVPGNHDVRLPADQNEDVESRERDAAAGSLLDWESFHGAFYATCPPQQPGPRSYLHELSVGGASVGIVALNSAWHSSGRNDEGRLLLGYDQVEPALRAISEHDLRLVVVHHPLDWLATSDAEAARQELAKQGVTVLSGHLHMAEAISHQSLRGELLFLRAGCLYDHRRFSKSYSIVDIDLATRTADVSFRRWYESRQTFDSDLEAAPSGRERFSLPLSPRQRALGHPPYADVVERIAVMADRLRDDRWRPHADSEIASIDELLVEPPLQEELQFGALAERNVTLVSGGPRLGVTSALLWILDGGYRLDSSRMPAYVASPDCGLGTAKSESTLAKAAGHFTYRWAGPGDHRLTLAIDDFDEASPRKRARILDFVVDNPQHHYLLGCREGRRLAILAELTARALTCGEAVLAPFGEKELRGLVAKARDGASADVERIAVLIRKEDLSRTPPTMLALITAAREDPGAESENELLGGYVDQLLGSDAAAGEELGLVRRDRLPLLGAVARWLHRKPQHAMPTAELENLLGDYFRRRGLTHSGGGVLRGLISRRILANKDGAVSFGETTLQHLFHAHWLLAHPRARSAALDDCGANGEAIRHVAALGRGDRNALEKVTAHAANAIEQAPGGSVDLVFAPFHTPGLWDDASFKRFLDMLPPRLTRSALNAETDRIEAVFEFEAAEEIGSTSAGAVLEQAVTLLVEVLNHSELVDDLPLKRRAFETAIEGWSRLLGLLLDDDTSEDSFHHLISTQVAALAPPEEEPDERGVELLTRMVALRTCAVSLQRRLDSADLGAVIESALDGDELHSRTAKCLATWLCADLELAGWPRRLSWLLAELPRGSFLWNATMAVGVGRYASSQKEVVLPQLMEILLSHGEPNPVTGGGSPRKVRRAPLRQRLQHQRLAFWKAETPMFVRRVELSSKDAASVVPGL